jgi:hypothetical protein
LKKLTGKFTPCRKLWKTRSTRASRAPKQGVLAAVWAAFPAHFAVAALLFAAGLLF